MFPHGAARVVGSTLFERPQDFLVLRDGQGGPGAWGAPAGKWPGFVRPSFAGNREWCSADFPKWCSASPGRYGDEIANRARGSAWDLTPTLPYLERRAPWRPGHRRSPGARPDKSCEIPRGAGFPPGRSPPCGRAAIPIGRRARDIGRGWRKQMFHPRHATPEFPSRRGISRPPARRCGPLRTVDRAVSRREFAHPV